MKRFNGFDIDQSNKDPQLNKLKFNIQKELTKNHRYISTGKEKNSLDIYVNDYCNVMCIFCIGRKSQKIGQSIKFKFEEIYNYLQDNIKYYDSIMFTGGGEPLLDFNIMRSLLDVCKEKQVYINTNGTELRFDTVAEYIEFHKNIHLNLNFQGLNNYWIKQNPKYFHEIQNKVSNFISNLRKLNKQITCKIIINKINKNNLFEIINDMYDSFEIKNFLIQPDYIDYDFNIDFNDLRSLRSEIKLSFRSNCEYNIDIITYKHPYVLSSGLRCETCVINNNDQFYLDKIYNELILMNEFIEKNCLNCKCFNVNCTPCYCHFATFNQYKDDLSRYSNCDFNKKTLEF